MSASRLRAGMAVPSRPRTISHNEDTEPPARPIMLFQWSISHTGPLGTAVPALNLDSAVEIQISRRISPLSSKPLRSLCDLCVSAVKKKPQLRIPG